MVSSDSKRNSARLFGAKRTLSLCVVLSILLSLSLSACKKTSNKFPTIPTSETSETFESETSETSAQPSSLELTIASPLSYETCQYLARLYYAKSNGLLGDGVTGATVDLDYLSSIDLPFVLDVYTTSENGCNISTLSQWKGSDMPDIFLTDSFDQAVSKGYALPINEYLAEIPLFSSDRIYPELISEFHVENSQYGIPYQMSAAVLFCDMEVLRQANIPSVSFRQSKSSLLELISEIAKLNEEEKTVLPFYLAANMVPYLPSSIYSREYLSASNGEERIDPNFRDSVAYVESIINSGYSYESLKEGESEALFEGISPMLSRKVGIWVGTTDEIPVYDNYMPNTLNMMQLPGIKDDEYSAPLIIAYPFCVSSTCKNPKEACELASFIALDEDALLLISRLSERTGYLPVVKTPSVWQSTVKNQKYGNYLMQYQELMDQAILIPEVSESETFINDVDYISKTIYETITSKNDDEN
ncbi:MAG: extracellular solute-binding protein [Clostridiales bacterium]|nr:extracellular solute-binding protein [Clostridiales bacterium]